MANKKSTLSNFIFQILLWIVARINPDWSHRLIVWGLRDGSFPEKKQFDPILSIDVLGKHFKNPIGVAAGIDKRGNVIDRLIEIGWGFGEFGSYTLEAEYPMKDLSYIRRNQAIVVHSAGYRNPGIATIAPVMAARRRLPYIVGVNITSTSQNEGANIKYGAIMSYGEEFAMMAAKVAPYCDFIVLNLAHPDCELYRVITERSIIEPVLLETKEAIKKAAPLVTPKMVVKIPPDLNGEQAKEVCNILISGGAEGVIVGGVLNMDKASLNIISNKKIHGGMLSGKPLKMRTLPLVGQMYSCLGNRMPIIAAGGIFTGQDAFDFILAGASLLEINTAITYKGPNVVNVINKDLAKLLKGRGYKSVQEAVGKAII